MNKLSIKTGDTVVVLSGKDKGKQGKVMSVMPEQSKVIVEKVNMVSRHTKPRQQGEQGGILQKEAPIYACKVQRVCPKCNKPTRPAHKLLADGSGLLHQRLPHPGTGGAVLPVPEWGLRPACGQCLGAGSSLENKLTRKQAPPQMRGGAYSFYRSICQ